MIIMLTPQVQPYAGLLPPRVLEPGKAVGTVTDQMAELTGLPKACTVCAGTSGLQWSLCLFVLQQLPLSSFGWRLLLKCWSLRLLLHNIKHVLYGRMLLAQTRCSVGILALDFQASWSSFCNQRQQLLVHVQQLSLSGCPLAECSCWNPAFNALHLPFSY